MGDSIYLRIASRLLDKLGFSVGDLMDAMPRLKFK